MGDIALGATLTLFGGAPGALLSQIRTVRAYIPGAASIRRIWPSPWSPSTLTFAT
jgi:hypothetical protein